jgi:argininosuccinate lyase
MENTGRIKKLLAPAARRILFTLASAPHSQDELQQMALIDQAHLLMLSEAGIINRNDSATLLEGIKDLQSRKFAPLIERESTRGLFLLYEDYLIETLGAQVGGILQTARSRNDLNATVLRMRLRRPFVRLLEQGLRFHAILLSRARKYADVVMPIYTHGQAAMPSTYGHYLAGITGALLRDFDGILAAAREIQSCPLGAGAAAGTSFSIRTARTAQLLGFDSGPLHSLDAVASRDLVLRLLAAFSIYSVTLSRLATDLFHWNMAEFDFLHLPDELVGSSSAMPQKRNPFLLEHVQGQTGSLLGSFVHAATAMHATPFSNAIAVGTEAVKPVWDALQNLTKMIVLMRLMIGAAQPNREAMLKRAVAGFTTASAFADRLVRDAGMDFRSAHKLIGAAVLESLESGKDSFEEAAAEQVRRYGIPVSFRDLGPASVVLSLESGGGPGLASMKYCLEHLQRKWADHYRQKRMQKKQWCEAEINLKKAVEKFVRKSGDRSRVARRSRAVAPSQTLLPAADPMPGKGQVPTLQVIK